MEPVEIALNSRGNLRMVRAVEKTHATLDRFLKLMGPALRVQTTLGAERPILGKVKIEPAHQLTQALVHLHQTGLALLPKS